MQIMLFSQKINTSAKGPKWAAYDNKHGTNGWINLSVINVSVESFLFTVSRWTPYVSCTSWKNYQAETDALNKNVDQYRGEAGLSQHPSWMKCLTN